MGEKGNEIGQGMAVAGVGEGSLVERVTTTTTQTVVGAGQDLAETIKDKAVDHGADAVIDEARSRVRRDSATPATPTDASDPAGTSDPAGGDDARRA